jgi:hypothetical protein
MIPKRPHPLWRELATPEEISEIAEIDRLIADLRRRRQSLINRAKLRTPLWVEHHVSPPRRVGQESATSHRHPRSDARRSKH